MAIDDPQWDAFISHASEDKESCVLPLFDELQKFGLKIWLDKFTLRVGMSLRESIDGGLAQSKFGIVVLSHAFFAKNWPPKELNGLFSRQVNGQNVILPIWHDLTKNDLLLYSPLMADLVAAKSSDGPVVVARDLVRVIKPSAFEFDASSGDAQRAAERIRERIEANHPGIVSSITIGPQNPSIQNNQIPGIVASLMKENMRIDFLALDRNAYEANPVTGSLKMTKDAWARFEEAINKGTTVEFEPGEVLGFSSSILDATFGPDALCQGAGKLIIMPAAESLGRKFKFRLTFRFADEQETLPYVEFEIIQPGRTEVTIRSCTPKMPLTFVLSVRENGKPSTLKLNISYSGHDVRKIYTAYRILHILEQGGNMEVVDLGTDQLFGRWHGAPGALAISQAPYFIPVRFLEVLHRVVSGFKNVEVLWNESQLQETVSHLSVLNEVVETGRAKVQVKEITILVIPQPGEILEKLISVGSPIRISQIEPPSFARIFGKVLELGPYFIEVVPVEIESDSGDGSSAERTVRIKTEGTAVFEFEKFVKN